LKKVPKLGFLTIGQYIESKKMSLGSQVDPVIFEVQESIKNGATSSIFQTEKKKTLELVLE
jgi:hypothetical protein